MKTNLLLALLIVFTFFNFAQATQVDLNVFYTSDKISSTNSPSLGLTNYDFALLMNSEGRTAFGIGWAYAIASLKSDSGTTGSTPLTYSSTETGPKFSLMMGKSQDWHVALIYNLSAKAKFEDANGSAEWRGTSIKAEFGYMPQVSSKIRVGVKFNYHSATYKEQITNSTTLTSSSNSRATIYPTISVTALFEPTSIWWT